MLTIYFLLPLILPVPIGVIVIIFFFRLLQEKRSPLVWFLWSMLCSVVAVVAFQLIATDSTAGLMIFIPPMWPILAAPVAFFLYSARFFFKALMGVLAERAPKVHAEIQKSVVISFFLSVFIIAPVLLFLFLAPTVWLLDSLGLFK